MRSTSLMTHPSSNNRDDSRMTNNLGVVGREQLQRQRPQLHVTISEVLDWLRLTKRQSSSPPECPVSMASLGSLRGMDQVCNLLLAISHTNLQ
jgi:hypothetical protein